MKRLIALFLAVCLLLSGMALAELSEDVKAVLLERTEALTALMVESASNESYLMLYLGQENDDMADTIRTIVASGWEKPEDGKVFVLREGAVDTFLSASRLSPEDFPDSLHERIRQDVAGFMPQAVVNQAGIELMRAVTVLRTGEVFLADEGFPDGVMVYLRYNPNYAVLCSYVKNADEIVSASLVPVPADCEDQMKQVLSLNGLFGDLGSLYEEYKLVFAQE